MPASPRPNVAPLLALAIVPLSCHPNHDQNHDARHDASREHSATRDLIVRRLSQHCCVCHLAHIQQLESADARDGFTLPVDDLPGLADTYVGFARRARAIAVAARSLEPRGARLDSGLRELPPRAFERVLPGAARERRAWLATFRDLERRARAAGHDPGEPAVLAALVAATERIVLRPPPPAAPVAAYLRRLAAVRLTRAEVFWTLAGVLILLLVVDHRQKTRRLGAPNARP